MHACSSTALHPRPFIHGFSFTTFHQQLFTHGSSMALHPRPFIHASSPTALHPCLFSHSSCLVGCSQQGNVFLPSLSLLLSARATFNTCLLVSNMYFLIISY
ncbi:PRR21 isoform 1 [Pongo abelii]|uniref:PRR21 isoform 1 n=1 Tax=Pongo abelii TaxID=9601 RepID=A0A2J8R7Z7_PONAB|nr:PRR21 isoform 1 [Pongo abelii]